MFRCAITLIVMLAAAQAYATSDYSVWLTGDCGNLGHEYNLALDGGCLPLDVSIKAFAINTNVAPPEMSPASVFQTQKGLGIDSSGVTGVSGDYRDMIDQLCDGWTEALVIEFSRDVTVECLKFWDYECDDVARVSILGENTFTDFTLGSGLTTFTTSIDVTTGQKLVIGAPIDNSYHNQNALRFKGFCLSADCPPPPPNIPLPAAFPAGLALLGVMGGVYFKHRRHAADA